MNKYYNKKTTINGIQFDSKKEASRYYELWLLEKSGYIDNLKLQPKFLLQPSFKKNGKTYRKIEYIADFMYFQDGKIIIEDTKGHETEVFKLKHKMFEYKYPEYQLKIIK